MLDNMLNKIIFNISRVLRSFNIGFDQTNYPKLSLMKKEIKELNGINFKIEFYPNGSWTAESVNIDGIITGSDNVKEINFLIKDAVFTYFEIPPQFCDDSFLKADNEPLTITQKVYA